MSGWAQRDAERREDEANELDDLRAEVTRLTAEHGAAVARAEAAEREVARLRAAVRELVAAENDAARHAPTTDRHTRYHAAWDALRAIAAEVTP